jgi:hypothetical protein
MTAAGLLMVVEKFPGMNTLDVTEDVEAALNELAPGLRGRGVNPTSIVRGLHRGGDRNLQTGGAARLGLLLLLLVGFFANWRTTLICFLSIPLSLIAAAMVLQWTGASLNASCSPGSRSPSGSSPTMPSWTWTASHGGCARPTPAWLGERTARDPRGPARAAQDPALRHGDPVARR